MTRGLCKNPKSGQDIEGELARFGLEKNKYFDFEKILMREDVVNKRKDFSFIADFHEKTKEGVLREIPKKKVKKLGLSFSRIVEESIFFLLGILSFGSTLFFTGMTVQGIIFDRYIFFLFLAFSIIVLWVLNGIYTGGLRVKRTPLDMPFLLFCGAYGISMIFSKDVWHSFTGDFFDPSRGFIMVITSVLLFYAVLGTQTKRSLLALTGFFIAGLSFFTVWSIVALSGIFQGMPGIFSFFASVPINDVLALAIIVAITFPLVLAFFLQTVSFKMPSWLKGLAVILGFLIFGGYLYIMAVLSFTIAVFALFVGLGIFVAYIYSEVIYVSKGWRWLPFFLFLGIFPIFYFFGQDVLVKKGTELNQPIFSGMKTSWETSKHVLGDHFLTGTGPATYGYAFSRFSSETRNEKDISFQRSAHPRNYFLEMVATTGVLGGVTFMLLLAFALSFSLYLLTRRNKGYSIVTLGYWISIFVLCILGSLCGISGSVVLVGLVLSIFGGAYLFCEGDAKMSTRLISFRSAPQYVVALFFIFLMAFFGTVSVFLLFGKIFSADMYAGRAFQEQKKDVWNAIEYIEKAIALNEKEGRYSMFRGQMYFALVSESLESMDLKSGEEAKERTRQMQEWIGETIRSLVRGRDLLPGNIFAQQTLAQTLKSLGSLEDALEAYKEANQIDPKNPEHFVEMAKIRIMQAEKLENKEPLYTEAERYIGNALALKKEYGGAWYQKAIIEEGRKDFDFALVDAQKALELDRDILSGLLVARLFMERGKEGDLKEAENILMAIVKVNEKELNTQLMLADLYTKTNRKEDAIALYEEVREALPENSSGARSQIDAIVEKIKKGGSVMNESSQDLPSGESVLERND